MCYGYIWSRDGRDGEAEHRFELHQHQLYRQLTDDGTYTGMRAWDKYQREFDRLIRKRGTRDAHYALLKQHGWQDPDEVRVPVFSMVAVTTVAVPERGNDNEVVRRRRAA